MPDKISHKHKHAIRPSSITSNALKKQRVAATKETKKEKEAELRLKVIKDLCRIKEDTECGTSVMEFEILACLLHDAYTQRRLVDVYYYDQCDDLDATYATTKSGLRNLIDGYVGNALEKMQKLNWITPSYLAATPRSKFLLTDLGKVAAALAYQIDDE